jgi:membrane-bound lytic murein transglycosylase F
MLWNLYRYGNVIFDMLSCDFKRRLLAAAAVLFVLGSLLSCGRGERADALKIDLPQIRERGKLIAITTYSSTSYFIYRGQPMGYEYELLNRLADHLGLNLEIVLAKNLDSLIAMLHEADGDIVAHNLTVTKERKQQVAFTDPHTTTFQVLVQRKPENWRQLKRHEIEDSLIRNPLDLIGKKVHVRKNSSYYERLVNLSEEMGGDIDIVAAPGDKTTEELIHMVAEGEIDYTVADQNLASINQTYDRILDVKTRLSMPQQVAWAVRKSSPKLLKAVNEWIEEMKETADYNVIYNKYFENRKAFRRRLHSQFFSRTGDKISSFDAIIRTQAERLDWDWRLLASMIYQESQFQPNKTSWAGAVGLMQMMPATAEHFGATELTDPEENIKAGVAYLSYLQKRWRDVPDSLERLKFVLGSYNAGENHVSDARRLAEKYGADPNLWDGNVAKYLLLKSKPIYYNDEVVHYGYCRGEEPVQYVREVLERYEHYRNVIALKPG